MFTRYTSALLFAATAAQAADTGYVYSETKSMSAINKMRTLSDNLKKWGDMNAVNPHSSVCMFGGTEDASPPLTDTPFITTSAADDIIATINGMKDVMDDIPGIGFILDIAKGGNSDTKLIMQQLDAIKSELDEMHTDMTIAYQQIMKEGSFLYCATDIMNEEKVVFASFTDFKYWIDALNNGSDSGVIAAYKGTFLKDCDENKCLNASRYLLNALAPKGAWPTLQCDFLAKMWDCSGTTCYEGYRDYIAIHGANMLLESMVSQITTTIKMIDDYGAQGLTPLDALGMTVQQFGQWTKDAAKALTDRITDAKTKADETRLSNIALIRMGQSANHGTASVHIFTELSKLYPWNIWGVTVSNNEYWGDYRQMCFFDYHYDNALSVDNFHDRNDDQLVIVQLDGATQKGNIESFMAQPSWSRWTNEGYMCSSTVRCDLQECGCGGGSVIVQTQEQQMCGAWNGDRVFKWMEGNNQTIFAWADHECSCNWPYCNAAAEFVEKMLLQ